MLIGPAGHQIDTPAKIESADHKFMATGVMISTENGSPKIVEIELGGSTNKIVFE
jgi:hypothetical protein